MEIKHVHVRAVRKVPGYSFHVGIVEFERGDMTYSIDITNEEGKWHTPKKLTVIHESDGYCSFCEKKINLLVDPCIKSASDMWKEIEPKIRLRLLFHLYENKN